jgi:hypothetical protein
MLSMRDAWGCTMPEKQELPFTGDVVARADLTINTKGGSTTAILKKAIRERLGALGQHLPAAALEFSTGQAIVLLAGNTASQESWLPVRVCRVGRNRFEIAIETDASEEVDEVTAAFLRLKRDQFAKGTLRLVGPVTAEEWRADMDRQIGAAEAAQARARRRTPARRSTSPR